MITFNKRILSENESSGYLYILATPLQGKLSWVIKIYIYITFPYGLLADAPKVCPENRFLDDSQLCVFSELMQTQKEANKDCPKYIGSKKK